GREKRAGLRDGWAGLFLDGSLDGNRPELAGRAVRRFRFLSRSVRRVTLPTPSATMTPAGQPGVSLARAGRPNNEQNRQGIHGDRNAVAPGLHPDLRRVLAVWGNFNLLRPPGRRRTAARHGCYLRAARPDDTRDLRPALRVPR